MVFLAAPDFGGRFWPASEPRRPMASMSANAPAAEPVGLLPAPPGWIGGDLSGLDDRELLALAGSLPGCDGRRGAARDLLVVRYRNLVRSCVQRYSGGREPVEDLMQVGYVGLVKAINNFDPALGFSLGSYATPCIVGEIKRYFRDKSWQVHVERPLQELVLQVRDATIRLTQQLGRTPTDSELAGDLAVGDADVRDARRAHMVLQPLSLDEPLRGRAGTASLAELLGEEDPGLEHVLGMLAVSAHWGELPAREQKILVLRFYGGMTQAQIGEQVGISQMQVSRLLAHALGYLRPRIFGLPECAAEAVPDVSPRTDLTGVPGDRPAWRRSVTGAVNLGGEQRDVTEYGGQAGSADRSIPVRA
jgi:RNA polymerase sigma-B factor